MMEKNRKATGEDLANSIFSQLDQHMTARTSLAAWYFQD
jgi:hypothetical protein